jgi:hypothetical protein
MVREPVDYGFERFKSTFGAAHLQFAALRFICSGTSGRFLAQGEREKM